MSHANSVALDQPAHPLIYQCYPILINKRTAWLLNQIMQMRRLIESFSVRKRQIIKQDQRGTVEELKQDAKV